MKKIKINYKGKEYPSLLNFCSENNYDYRLILQRMQSGKTIDEALRNVENKDINGKEIFYKGIYYPSITVLCKKMNLNVSTFQGRLKNGWSIEDAIEIPMRKNEKRVPSPIIYKGKTFKSLKELCDTYGFNYTNTSTRLRRGYSFEDALEKPNQKIKKEN